MKIFSGDELGLIKQIDPKSKTVISTYGTQNLQNEVINIIKEGFPINENADEDKLNLFITEKRKVYNMEWNSKKVISTYTKDEEDKYNFTSSVIKQTPEKNFLFLSSNDDTITILSQVKKGKFLFSKKISPVDTSNKSLRKNLYSIEDSFNTNTLYGLYENNPLIEYDITKENICFKAKNLPDDELGLRIPIFDTCLREVKNKNRLIYVSTASGEIRLYDKKASPKPSSNIKISKSKINKIALVDDDGSQIIVADNKGYCALLDTRNNCSIIKNFRDNTASIKDLKILPEKKFAIIGGLERFVKWYNYETGSEERVYAKNKINSVLVDYNPEEDENEEEEEGSMIEESELDNEDIEDNEEEDNDEESEELSKIDLSNESLEDEDEEEESNKNKKVKNQKKNIKESSEEEELELEELSDDEEESDEEESEEKNKFRNKRRKI